MTMAPIFAELQVGEGPDKAKIETLQSFVVTRKSTLTLLIGAN